MLAPLLAFFLPAIARADAVGPCMPMFKPSHSGCRFAPTPMELGVAGAVLFAVVGAVVILVIARSNKRNPRD